MPVKLLAGSLCSVLFMAALLQAQRSPASEATGSIGGKGLSIKYGAPSVRGRQIFGDGGRISKDPNYPVWRAGADSATAFHTDGDLNIGGLTVPKGDYSLYVLVKDPDAWQLIINKQTGQWGLTYDESKDLGRVKMIMSKPPLLVEQLKYAIIPTPDGKQGQIQLQWEHHVAGVEVKPK